MCGRFALKNTPTELQKHFDTVNQVPHEPRYNIAPSQSVPVILEKSFDRHMMSMRWGLIPNWAKDASIGNRLINARAETIQEKPSFRQSFQKRRCIIPATGFYEWQDITRDPYYFYASKEQEILAIAGIWDKWQVGDDEPIYSFSMITIEGNDIVKPVHTRMPLVLSDDRLVTWLAPSTDKLLLETLLRSSYVDIKARLVSRLINSPSHDSPSCIEPV